MFKTSFLIDNLIIAQIEFEYRPKTKFFKKFTCSYLQIKTP